MNPKQIDVQCPCCNTLLSVDVGTRQVLRAVSPREVDEHGKPKLDEGRWDSATQRARQRSETAGDKLEEALSEERNKSDRLDELFRKANEKLSEEPDEDGR